MAVSSLYPMSPLKSGSCALSSKGIIRVFIPWFRNQTSSTARSMLAITAAGKASWTLGISGPGVYLSSGDLIGACWVSFASPCAVAAAARSRMVLPLGVPKGWSVWFPWMVMAMLRLAWAVRFWMVCRSIGVVSLWIGVFWADSMVTSWVSVWPSICGGHVPFWPGDGDGGGDGDLSVWFLAISRVLMVVDRSFPRRDMKIDGDGALLIMLVSWDSSFW